MSTSIDSVAGSGMRKILSSSAPYWLRQDVPGPMLPAPWISVVMRITSPVGPSRTASTGHKSSVRVRMVCAWVTFSKTTLADPEYPAV